MTLGIQFRGQRIILWSGSTVYPQSTFIFKHALTQEVAYESLLLQRRKILHGRVGLTMEALYQDRIEEQVNVLYYHFNEAENWPKAVRYGRQAADKASRLNQYGEAVQKSIKRALKKG